MLLSCSCCRFKFVVTHEFCDFAYLSAFRSHVVVYARPISKGDGSSDIMNWDAGIPGKDGTDWEGGVFKVSMEFSEDYPSKPPKCKAIELLVVFSSRYGGYQIRKWKKFHSNQTSSSVHQIFYMHFFQASSSLRFFTLTFTHLARFAFQF